MDTVVIDFKSGDTFFTHRYTNCSVTILDNWILKIALDDGYIYYTMRMIEHITIISAEEEEE